MKLMFLGRGGEDHFRARFDFYFTPFHPDVFDDHGWRVFILYYSQGWVDHGQALDGREPQTPFGSSSPMAVVLRSIPCFSCRRRPIIERMNPGVLSTHTD